MVEQQSRERTVLQQRRLQRLICSSRRSDIPAMVPQIQASNDALCIHYSILEKRITNTARDTHTEKQPISCMCLNYTQRTPTTAYCKALCKQEPGHTYRKTAYFVYVSHLHHNATPLQHSVRHFANKNQDTHTEKQPISCMCLIYISTHPNYSIL